MGLTVWPFKDAGILYPLNVTPNYEVFQMLGKYITNCVQTEIFVYLSSKTTNKISIMKGKLKKKKKENKRKKVAIKENQEKKS